MGRKTNKIRRAKNQEPRNLDQPILRIVINRSVRSLIIKRAGIRGVNSIREAIDALTQTADLVLKIA
jgi:hypothetical protein